MSSNYAKNTKIDVSKTQNEIKDILIEYGVTKFAFDLSINAIFFEVNNKPVKVYVPLPNFEKFRYTPTKQKRTDIQTQNLYDQDIKARWRLMKEFIAKSLEMVRLELMNIEQVFLGNFILINGKTLSEELIPQLKEHTPDTLFKLPDRRNE